MPPSETGTVIITGANGSCATPFVSHLLTHYPSLTLLATVRNASPSDPNTARLNDIMPTSSQASIEPLDLASLSSVRAFAEKTAQRVKGGEIPPIKAIVCNACTMSLKEQVYTEDGFERTFQVNHLSHYLLVLKLLGSMSQDGRIVMLGSNTHYTDRPHPLFNMRVGIPKDVETLVKPKPDVVGKEYDHGFHRYGITTAMDPGGMVDSRAHKIQTPLIRFVFGLIVLLLPILKYFTDELRSSAQSGQELAELAVGDKYQGEKGYFMGARREKEDAICMDADKRDVLWKACWEWAGVKKEETVLGE
ncbi:dehydrogenase reductase [Fusarium sporotrichioides]|uniref:3beta-hydroxysteroid 3-dehydrogenase n=1 Tax=Fusarium sporotrichioides TaxID=5514 RepID=A0A395SQ43_FUSSP|nr:dehydrogenase reductase [Fusarium sporotrichioides]